jgi:hypothetical protein
VIFGPSLTITQALGSTWTSFTLSVSHSSCHFLFFNANRIELIEQIRLIHFPNWPNHFLKALRLWKCI